MHLTLGAIDAQDNALVDCFGYSTFYPFDIQPFEALEVILLSKQLGLEPAHLAGAGRVPVRAFPANDHSHSWVF